MSKRKPKSGNAEAARRREHLARQRISEYEAAFGIDGYPKLKRLISAYGALVVAADPMPSQQLAGSSGGDSTQFGKPQPGQATRGLRAARRAVDRQLGHVLDRIEATLNDPGYRPPRGPRCVKPDCGRVGRPGDRFCSTCSTPLGGSGESEK